VAEAGDSVVAEAFAAAVAEHSDYLGVFLAFFLEFEFAFGFFAVSFSSAAVFASFSCCYVGYGEVRCSLGSKMSNHAQIFDLQHRIVEANRPLD
jgi:hypothetical protein